MYIKKVIREMPFLLILKKRRSFLSTIHLSNNRLFLYSFKNIQVLRSHMPKPVNDNSKFKNKNN